MKCKFHMKVNSLSITNINPYWCLTSISIYYIHNFFRYIFDYYYEDYHLVYFTEAAKWLESIKLAMET